MDKRLIWYLKCYSTVYPTLITKSKGLLIIRRWCLRMMSTTTHPGQRTMAPSSRIQGLDWECIPRKGPMILGIPYCHLHWKSWWNCWSRRRIRRIRHLSLEPAIKAIHFLVAFFSHVMFVNLQQRPWWPAMREGWWTSFSLNVLVGLRWRSEKLERNWAYLYSLELQLQVHLTCTLICNFLETARTVNVSIGVAVKIKII